MASKHQAVRTEPVRAWRGVQVHALDAILRDAVDLAIWERALAAGLSAAIGQADLSGVEFLRFETPADRVAEELCLAFLEAGIEGDGWALAEDAQLLACAFARNLGIDDVAIRLEHVTGDACRRFHADYVSARLITTQSRTLSLPANSGRLWVHDHINVAVGSVKAALSNERGLGRDRVIAPGYEPQIEGKTAEPIPTLSLIARDNPVGGSDVRAVLAVAAGGTRLGVSSRSYSADWL